MKDKKRDEVARASELVFLRYGYSRATMSDIAKAAGISRPALYLIFQSKEEVFSAVGSVVFSRMLSEIRSDTTSHRTIEDKLLFIFDIWFVQPHKIILAYPDASDLIESMNRYASDVKELACQEFVEIVAGILSLLKPRVSLHFSNLQISKMMADAVLGFKLGVKSNDELIEQIRCLIQVTLANYQIEISP